MYYNFYYFLILKNYFNYFNKNLIDYFTGKFNELEFKFLRLQNGLYRQKFSYMLRIGIPYGKLNFFQFYIFSYISFFYDKKYLHFTTRTNIQLNWLKLFYIFEVFKKISLLFLHSIQTSGNCVRNITTSNYFKLYSESWGELVRQWFSFNSEFIFLPRKFKIAILSSKKDDIVFKTHDLGLNLRKNKLNDIFFNILIGGGMGRNPNIGIYILKFIYWKNILNYLDKIIRIYNVYGFRNNIYRSRLKILVKSLNSQNILNFINKEFSYSNSYIYIITEKELNFFFYNFKKKKINNIFFLKKKVLFNFFFLNWLKYNYINNFYFCLPLKNNNIPPGDINYLQIKIIYFLFFKSYFLKLFNRQNILFLNNFKFYFNYLKIKKFFFNIFNFNLLTDIISCPGKDYCNLANAKSISISNLIQEIFIDFNSLFKIGKIFLNISGCINSCSHHHVSNFGFLGVNKNNKDNYQIYIGGNYNNYYNSLLFSKVLTSSFIYFNSFKILIKILKLFLKYNLLKKFFTNFDFLNLKSFI